MWIILKKFGGNLFFFLLKHSILLGFFLQQSALLELDFYQHCMLGRLPFCILGELGRGHSYRSKSTGFLFHVNTFPVLFDQLLLGLFACFFVLQKNNNNSS